MIAERDLRVDQSTINRCIVPVSTQLLERFNECMTPPGTVVHADLKASCWRQFSKSTILVHHSDRNHVASSAQSTALSVQNSNSRQRRK